ncbi:MAG TPA: hypothetical protein VIZ91_01370 [Solirubrobacterales bacterium]
MADALTDEELVGVLQRYLTILQGHPPAEKMMEETLTDDFAETRLNFFLRSWTPPSPTSDEYTGKCFHSWRVREVDGEWRVAAQMVERFDDLNENSKQLFATPDEGLNR